METKEIKCPVCFGSFNKPLFRYQYNKASGRRNLCSRKCRNLYLASIGYKRPVTWVNLICFLCKKKFKTSKTNNSVRVKRNTIRVFCSMSCKNKFQSKGGKFSPMWKGGRRQYPSQGGYVMLRIAPNKRIFEHRFVMERHLNRKLKVGEVVHHINGNPADNRVENLVVCKSAGYHSTKYHPKQRKYGRWFPNVRPIH